MARAWAAEFLGTLMLVCTVVGSGIMADALSDDVAVSLLGNTIATGAILYVLILILGPISGAHFNPAVSLVMALRGGLAGPTINTPASANSLIFFKITYAILNWSSFKSSSLNSSPFFFFGILRLLFLLLLLLLVVEVVFPNLARALYSSKLCLICRSFVRVADNWCISLRVEARVDSIWVRVAS